MQALILGRNDEILAKQELQLEGNMLIGSGSLSVTILRSGFPTWLVLMEDGRAIANGKFGRDIVLPKENVSVGDEVHIKLTL